MAASSLWGVGSFSKLELLDPSPITSPSKIETAVASVAPTLVFRCDTAAEEEGDAEVWALGWVAAAVVAVLEVVLLATAVGLAAGADDDDPPPPPKGFRNPNILLVSPG